MSRITCFFTPLRIGINFAFLLRVTEESENPAQDSRNIFYEMKKQLNLADDEATHQQIAVKIPHPISQHTGQRFVDSPSHKESLLREVQKWIDLVHPNIVNAFDLIDDQSTDYFTLADRLDATIQVCWALEYKAQRIG